MGIRLPKIRVGKFLKKVGGVALKVGHVVPGVSSVVQAGEDAVGIFKKKRAAGQSASDAAANTAASYSPEAQTQKMLLYGAAAVILFLLIKR